MFCQSHSSRFNPNRPNIWWKVQIINLLIILFSYPSVTFLVPNIVLSTLCCNILNLCCFTVRDQVEHPYKTTCKSIASLF
jgi:hypothetical protein